MSYNKYRKPIIPIAIFSHDRQEEEQLMDEVRKLPGADQIFDIPISYEEKGKEIGKEIAKKEW